MRNKIDEVINLNWKKSVIGLIISIILVVFSVFIPTKVYSPNEFSSIRFGYPIHFVQQNQGWMGYEGDYPHYFSIALNFLEHPLERRVLPLEFILSVVIVWLMVFIVWIITAKIFKRIS